MKDEYRALAGTSTRVVTLHTAVVGTGAAGYNAALRLRQYGVADVAILTEGVNMGTSRNTGSDKQTYYKMDLCGDSPDCPAAMARDLFAGRCVDGDIAYAEAALSVPCFLHLAELGVPFPVNRLGEYVGYKTDHDPRTRATSAGPLTSKLMTECLQKAAAEAGIPVLDRLLAVEILKVDDRAVGLIALDTQRGEPVAVLCENVVWATGGPAGLYADTVYPLGHSGASGTPFAAGVKGRNLTEWQYGLASTHPRWNVSGTYMQVLPRFVSVDENGEKHYFLEEYFPDPGTCLSRVFRKGYEWPFDSRKAQNGSSVVDLLVYREQVLKGRQVFMDFRENPYGLADLPYDGLEPEARDYLQNAEACFGTPLARLLHMNAPAYDLYKSKGVDLATEGLAIALCAQHNNGGLAVDCWWQTDLPHLFACGETAGTHGVYRPGGSALNAGQVGSMRAAQYIAYHPPADPPADEAAVLAVAETAVTAHRARIAGMRAEKSNVAELTARAGRRMSACGGAIRDPGALAGALREAQAQLAAFDSETKVCCPTSLYRAFRLRDALTAKCMYLAARADYAATGGGSRGSAIYTDPEGVSAEGLESLFRFRLDDGGRDGMVQELTLTDNGPVASWRPVRPLPEGGGFFETVWRQYRETHNVD
ncbi:MAG: FAD-binding protein [Clostridia bacterium]|nr:FAD-binding protein [Clostridia bacterium]